MSNIVGWDSPGQVDVMGTALNGLTNGSAATGTDYDNTPGGANNYPFGDLELNITTSSNMGANNTVDVYILPAEDGTDYASTAGPPPNSYVDSFVCQVATALRIVIRGILLPPTHFKFYVINGSGQTFLSGTFKLTPYRAKIV